MNAKTDLNLCNTHRAEGTFSDVAAHMLMNIVNENMLV